jgi:hypothetical protein
MNAHAKTFGSPSGEPSTTRPYASTNVRKTLDTTASDLDANDEADIAGWPSDGFGFIITSSNPSSYVVQKGASRW